jgi:hypothetical protein
MSIKQKTDVNVGLLLDKPASASWSGLGTARLASLDSEQRIGRAKAEKAGG